MTILRWTPKFAPTSTPWREIDRLRQQVEGLLDGFVEGVDSIRKAPGVYPHLNLAEDDDNLYLTAELPGVSPDDIELNIQGDSLTLRGERKIKEADSGMNYHRRERDSGYFRRVVNLPVRINAEKAEASAKNGILKVVLPKADEAKARMISVQS